MVSKREKAAVMVVVVIAVLATMVGLAYLANLAPKQTPADQMIIRPSDLGANWTDGHDDRSRFPIYQGQTSESNYSLNFYDGQSEFIGFFVSLWVLNTSDSAREAIELQRSLWNDITNFSIEDSGFLFNITDGGVQGLTFIRGNIMCQFYTSSAYPPSHSLNAWALGYAAPLQVEKIDHYLVG